MPSVAMISSLAAPQAEGRDYPSLHFRVTVHPRSKSGLELRANNWRQERKPEECCLLLGTSLAPVTVLTVLAHLPREATVHRGPRPPLLFNNQDKASQI